MTSGTVTIRKIGREGRPLVVIDGFAADPDAVRAAALGARYEPAAHHYPGIRGALPGGYLVDQTPVVADLVRTVFGQAAPVAVIDASYSIVTTPPANLTIRQRLPHCDAFAAERIALVHFLSPGEGERESGGTAFYRHRSTGFETIDEQRAPVFFGQLEAELRHGGVPAARYPDGDTALFERIMLVPARYNRALLYGSYLLHSGAIPSGAALSLDPATGRLTVTAFLSTGGLAAGIRPGR